MASNIRRYARTPILIFGQKYGTSEVIPIIRENCKNGNIRTTDMVLTESERLDILAGEIYGDGKLWWIIAAASEIAYAAQIPPGTLLRIPNLSDVMRLVG